jgi:hypothetical protein
MALHLNLGWGCSTEKNIFLERFIVNVLVKTPERQYNCKSYCHLQFFLCDVTAHKFLLNKLFPKTRKFKGKELIGLSYAE